MRAKALVLALVLLWATGAGAAQDFNGSTGTGSAATAEVTSYPMTFACWGKADVDTSNLIPVAIFNSASEVDYLAMSFGGQVAGDPIRAVAVGTGAGVAVTSTGFTAGTWHSGVVVFTNATSRAAYIDGTSKGTNTTSITPSSLNSTSIGAVAKTTAIYFDGSVAECGIWNVALTDDDAAMLGKGFAPPCVKRANLVAYYPLVRDTTSLKDQFSATANNLALAGTTAVADHPRILNCN